ncbi:class A beta-lactamase|uniref:class A beta-lactamase n=1 Tax=Noviherbaspirillum sp. L7-7A TaxID=2850560 RepID=UPI001C2C0AA1|nr:class A beta-lactamase [Noviherbaspirillum sp. L7-7A]MBV0879239.1 class A beta-lactamase [Noviherbaspirillum sp. L7-7A]
MPDTRLLPLPRRRLLLRAAALPLLAGCQTSAPTSRDSAALAQLQALEQGFDGRLGLCAIETGSGRTLAWRADERFPLCSTFKAVLAAAVLAQSSRSPGLLQRRMRYTRQDLVTYSPVTGAHVGDGMTVGELCAAAIQHSDNTAGNLLLQLVGGPSALTAYARSVGDMAFRLDRWETALNSALPGDERDTTTPAAMSATLKRLALDAELTAPQRAQLQDWLLGNTTGGSRIRAGMPAGWRVGDKTGTGDYGSTNDIAVLWPPQRAPVTLAIYLTGTALDARPRNEIVAQAARIVADWLA